MKKIISVLLLTMYIVSNFAFTVSAEGAGGAGGGGGTSSTPSTDISIYTENFFGDAYYNCDTVTEGVGVQGTSGGDAFEESVEIGSDAYGTVCVCVCVCITESLCCTPAANTLQINSTSIKNLYQILTWYSLE